MDVTWLTQCGWLVESGLRVAIDPYLSDHCERTLGRRRLTPAPLSPEALKPNLVIATTTEPDHLDPDGLPRLARACPEARFAGPPSVTERMRELGLRPIEGLFERPGGAQFGPFRIESLASEESRGDAPVGVLVEETGASLYISGDLIAGPELARTVLASARHPIRLAAVAITAPNGSVTIREAAAFVRELRPRAATPMHWGLFAEATADPQPFLEACRKEGIAADLLSPGRPYALETFGEEE